MARKQLFNLADKATQEWQPFVVGTDYFDLSHLDAHLTTFTHPTRDEVYRLHFTYSHHVFTSKLETMHSVDDRLIYPYRPDPRVFNLERYQLSLYLPEIITNLPKQFLYHGGYSRYCSCRITTDNGDSIYYQVVYRVWRGHGKLRFHIESAYPLGDKPKGVKKIDFWVICHNFLRGKKLPAPAN